MTAFDDTPLGEHPDLPARSGVDALLGAAASTWSAAVHAVAEIRALHRHVEATSPLVGKHPGWCTQCGVSWPCQTVSALEKWGLT